MKKHTASGARGYMSQMAEPVVAGESTLRVRHRAHGWEAQNMSAAPQEIVETHRPTASHAMQGEGNWSVKRDSSDLIDGHVTMDAEERTDRQRQINSAAETDTIHRGVQQAQKQIDPIGKLAAENSGEEPSRAQRFRPVVTHKTEADDADTSHRVMFEQGDVVQEQHLTAEETNTALHSGTRLREKFIREQRSEDSSEDQKEEPPTFLSDTHSMMKAWAQSPMEALAKSPEPKPILSQNQPQQKSGTAIHIGTIEGRTVHRPEPVAPAASPAVMSQPPAAPAGPLARSLNWRYGLVQG